MSVSGPGLVSPGLSLVRDLSWLPGDRGRLVMAARDLGRLVMAARDLGRLVMAAREPWETRSDLMGPWLGPIRCLNGGIL